MGWIEEELVFTIAGRRWRSGTEAWSKVGRLG